MNHIFKTLLNRKTGEINVVSENARCGHKSNSLNSSMGSDCDHKTSIHYSRKSFKKTVLAYSTSLIFFSLLNTASFAADQTYNSSVALQNISAISGNLNKLLGSDILQGVISTEPNNDISLSNANLIIDYTNATIPDFSIAGYSGLFGSNQTTSTLNNNSVTLKNGNINGHVYAGLVHYTLAVNSQNCATATPICGAIFDTQILPHLNLNSNLNTIQLTENPIHITEDLNSGYSDTHLFFGNFTAGKEELSPANLTSQSGAYAYTYAIADENQQTTNENTLRIESNNNIIDRNINTGSSNINLIFESNQGGIAIFNGNNTSNIIGASADADIHAYASLNKLISNQNTLTITGHDNKVSQNINAGNSSLRLYFANIQGGTADAHDGGSASEAIASAYSLASIYENQLTSNFNSIKLEGNNNTIGNSLNAGSSTINVNFGNLQGGTAYASSITSAKASAFTHSEGIADGNILTANQNEITIHGDQNTIANTVTAGSSVIRLEFGNMQAGQVSGAANTVLTDAYVHAYYSSQDIELTTNQNTINLMGNNNTVNGNIVAGQSIIDSSFENLEAKTASNRARADVIAFSSRQNLASNDNSILIKGNNNTFNSNVNTGISTINIDLDKTQAESDIVDIDISAALANLTSNRNTITIDGNNNTIAGDLSAGTANVKIDLGESKSISSTVEYRVNLIRSLFEANENTINLKGSSIIDGNIYGGYVGSDIQIGNMVHGNGTPNENEIYLNESQAYAINNTINIDGSNTIDNPNTSLYGGYLAYSTINGTAYRPEIYDTFTGNTLNFDNIKPITVDQIANFQTYNFTLNPEYANKNIALINANQVILDTNINNSSDTNTKASDVYVVGIHSGKALDTNTKFILMEGKTLQGDGQGHLSQGVAQQGISLLYDIETQVDKPNNQVIAIIRGRSPENPNEPQVNPQLTDLLAGNLSGLMLLTRGADEIADNLQAAISDQNQKRGLIPYVILSGHYAHYNTGTGSHLKARGGLINTGLSFQRDQLTLGAFVESGWGTYDTYNRFINAQTVQGEGHNHFMGLGAYGHYDVNNKIYVDGSLRGGRLRTAYNTQDIKNATTDEFAGYHLNGNYFSAHVGSGYLYEVDQSNTIDFSLKYLWSRTQGQNLTIAGDPIHFNPLNSHRLRLKGENTYKMNTDYSVFTGLGFEYEFDGTAHGTTYRSYKINAPSVKGGTGLATLGLRYNPASNKDLTIDFKANTYFGQRDGASALLHLQYAF